MVEDTEAKREHAKAELRKRDDANSSAIGVTACVIGGLCILHIIFPLWFAGIGANIMVGILIFILAIPLILFINSGRFPQPPLFCTHCHSYISGSTGWICPYCRKDHFNRIYDICDKCNRQADLIECPRCKKVFNIGNINNDGMTIKLSKWVLASMFDEKDLHNLSEDEKDQLEANRRGISIDQVKKERLKEEHKVKMDGLKKQYEQMEMGYKIAEIEKKIRDINGIKKERKEKSEAEKMTSNIRERLDLRRHIEKVFAEESEKIRVEYAHDPEELTLRLDDLKDLMDDYLLRVK